MKSFWKDTRGNIALMAAFGLPAPASITLIVAGGLGWTLWALRDRPVWRWIVWGALIGFLAGVGSSVALAVLNP